MPCWTGRGADCRSGLGGVAQEVVGTAGGIVGNVVVSMECCGGVGSGGYCGCGIML